MASMTFHAAGERVKLTDMRIEGQSPALRAYIRNALRF
jgi:hypothetical protein